MNSLRQASESEWKARYNRDTEALKVCADVCDSVTWWSHDGHMTITCPFQTQLSKLRSSLESSRLEKERSEVEARRFKTLFEEETRKAQRLTSRLDRAKDRTATARTELT